MKKSLLKVLTLVMAVACVFCAFAGCNSTTPDNGGDKPTPEKPQKELSYVLNTDGASYKVTGFKGDAFGEIEIPETYEGKPVTIIARDAFKDGANKIRKVTVGKNVEVIETGAFAGCKNLETFTFAEGSKLKKIETLAIESGTAFNYVIIPASIEVIATEAFFGCDNVKLYLEIESAPQGFEENWDLIDFDTYGQKTVKAVVCFKGEWSLVNGIPTVNA
jgi:hypothetical protein